MTNLASLALTTVDSLALTAMIEPWLDRRASLALISQGEATVDSGSDHFRASLVMITVRYRRASLALISLESVGF